jgi:hypothetical protein
MKCHFISPKYWLQEEGLYYPFNFCSLAHTMSPVLDVAMVLLKLTMMFGPQCDKGCKVVGPNNLDCYEGLRLFLHR